MCDDAVGLEVVRCLQSMLQNVPGVTLRDTCEMGLSLLDFISGYESLIVVDAVQTHRAPPGTVHEVSVEDLGQYPSLAPHGLGLGEILALGREIGLPMPTRVKVLAVEVADPFTVSAQMSEPLRQALPGVVARVADMARAWCSPS